MHFLRLLTTPVSIALVGIFALGAKAHANIIFEQNFQSDNWLQNFNKYKQPPWVEGKERAKPTKNGGKFVLEVFYPKGKYGNNETGIQWKTYFDKSYKKLTLSYKVKFSDGFDFVKGGKLPGLVGGHRPGKPDSVISGGYKPNGFDGWSARMMWRRDGKVVQYLYHPDQTGPYGEDLVWKIKGKPVKFTPGHWHQVKTEITMNTPTKRDGIIRCWFDGELALEKKNIRFRDTDRFSIDALYFSTFFGGDDETWVATKDEYAYFDSFLIESDL